MEVRFVIDLESGLPHIDRHGVSTREVLEVLHRREAEVPSRQGTRLTEGQIEAGRILRVIYKINPLDDSILVITAYDLQGKALKAFRKRRRRRL